MWFPVTDDATRAVVADLVRKLRLAGQEAEIFEVRIDNLRDDIRYRQNAWAPEFAKVRAEIAALEGYFVSNRDKFRGHIKELDEAIGFIKQRIARFERRRTRIRGEIEDYFAD